MTKKMKKTFMTGAALFLTGLVFLFLSLNDDGLFAFVLLAFGAWELGDVISDYFFWLEEEEEDTRTWEEMVNEFKVTSVKLAIPMVLCMIIEVLMIGTGFRVYTLAAYLLTLSIYLLFNWIFTFNDYKKQVAYYSVYKENKVIR